MVSIAIVTAKPDRFKRFVATIRDRGADSTFSWFPSESEALQGAAETAPDLMVVDEKLGEYSDLAFVRELLTINAMINTAVVSRMTADQFDEAFEGLGVLMQLPPTPGRQKAEELINRLSALGIPVSKV